MTELFRFVQIRRLTDTEGDDQTQPSQPDEPSVDSPHLDFRDRLSEELRDLIEQGNVDAVQELVARWWEERRQGSGALLVGLTALGRGAGLTRGLGIVEVRRRAERRLQGDSAPQHLVKSGLLDELTQLTVDLVSAGLWLGYPAPGAVGEHTLRGIALVRVLADPSATDADLDAVINGEVRLPPLPMPSAGDAYAGQVSALLHTKAQLPRIRARVAAIGGHDNATLEQIGSANLGDLDSGALEVRATAERFGLPPQARLTALEEVIDSELEFLTAQAAELEALQQKSGIPPLFAPGYDHTPPLPPEFSTPPSVPAGFGSARILGRGDLMLVKYEHARYELSDIAHIENVLASENRGRTHTVDTLTEERTVVSESEVQENTKDTASTERFSLERATQESTRTTNTFEIGASISGGLGPVQAGVDTNVGSSTTQQGSESSAVQYAKETTERASELLRSEFSSTTENLVRTRIIEVNEHKFDNVGAGSTNISGIYRWVDKVESAQLYSYGERLMLEFVVPEPASHYTALAAGLPDPELGEDPGEFTLEPGDLTASNYLSKAAEYGAVGVSPPPPYRRFEAHTWADSPAHPNSKDQPVSRGYSVHTAIISIPEGYEATTAYLGATHNWTDREEAQDVLVVIGDQEIRLTDKDNAEKKLELNRQFEGELPFSAASEQEVGMGLSVRVLCRRTELAFEAWQLATWEILKQAHQERVAAYEAAKEAAAVRETFVPSPSEDQLTALEIRELKRGCITLMTAQEFDLFGALRIGPLEDVPRIDTAEAWAEADYIQFFESAVEWELMTYRFYPYFWAGRDRWPELMSRTSTNPQHEAFLQSGSARVIVPVREGYERAIGRYLEQGMVPDFSAEPWRGSTPPESDAVAELLAEVLDRPPEELPLGDPWEVIVPTGLIYLQETSELNPGESAA